MNPVELIERLAERGIFAVIVGGIALRLYDSPRVTQDLDLAVRTLDIDDIIDSMYADGFALVTAVDEESVTLVRDPTAADTWIEMKRPGSLSFIARPSVQSTGEFIVSKHRDVDVLSQVDFLIDLPIPYTRLRKNARTFKAGNTELLVASPSDIVALKKARPDRSSADNADIDYLNDLMAREGATNQRT